MSEQVVNIDMSDYLSPLFSIIIPVYNTEAYLEACLHSAMEQSEAAIEIIVVDDGSTDASAALAAAMAADDPRIRIFHQNNSGQGVARNAALRRARGKYIMFLDSDDTLNSRACEIIAQHFVRTGADVVSFGIRFVTEHGSLVASRSNQLDLVSHQPDILTDAMLDRNFLTSPCNKAYDRLLLVRNGIVFPPLRAYEDALFSRHVALYAERVAYIPEVLYCAVTRSGSTTRRMSVQNFEIAFEAIRLERALFVDALHHRIDESIFGAHVVKFLVHILLLAAFRIDDRQERAQCYRLANASGLVDYAGRRDVRRHLSGRSRLQLFLVHRPWLARWAALIATRLRITPY